MQLNEYNNNGIISIKEIVIIKAIIIQTCSLTAIKSPPTYLSTPFDLSNHISMSMKLMQNKDGSVTISYQLSPNSFWLILKSILERQLLQARSKLMDLRCLWTMLSKTQIYYNMKPLDKNPQYLIFLSKSFMKMKIFLLLINPQV